VFGETSVIKLSFPPPCDNHANNARKFSSHTRPIRIMLRSGDTHAAAGPNIIALSAFFHNILSTSRLQ
ncbi:MAG: hypothetical protein ACXWTW_03010, partial [Methylobacter sp.]